MFNFILNFKTIDKGYLWGFLEKILRSLTSPIAVVFIAIYLDLNSQGFLYMFISLLSIKFLLELGLTQILITFTAYENNKLKKVSYFIKGNFINYLRIKEIFKYALKWFIISSLIYFFLIFIVGFYFFYSSNEIISFWLYPFLLLCCLSSLEIAIIPLYAIKEGMGELEEVYKFKFIKALFFIVSFIIFLILNFGIWSFPLGLISTVAIDFIFLIKNRTLLAILLRNKSKNKTPNFRWYHEILPLQLRTGVGAIAGFVTFSLIVPFSFALLGPEVAGQVGMTIAIATGISSVSVLPAMISTQRISSLVERKNISDLNKLMIRLICITVIIHLMGLLIFSTLYYTLYVYYPVILNKILSFKLFFIYFLSMMLSIGTLPLAIYLRAHKKEPLMGLSIVTGIMISFGVYFGTLYFGVVGSALAFFTTFLLTFPYLIYIYFNFKRNYDKDFLFN